MENTCNASTPSADQEADVRISSELTRAEQKHSETLPLYIQENRLPSCLLTYLHAYATHIHTKSTFKGVYGHTYIKKYKEKNNKFLRKLKFAKLHLA